MPNTRHCAGCRDTVTAGSKGAPRLRTHTKTLRPSVHPEQLASDPVALA